MLLMKCADLRFDEIQVLDSATLELNIDEIDLQRFVDLTQDRNPLHVDESFGRQSTFKRNIVHGLLTTSYASTLVGMFLPGRNCLILSTQFDFLKPVFIGDPLIMIGIVEQKNELNKTLKVQLSVNHGADCVIRGTILVKVGDNGNF